MRQLTLAFALLLCAVSTFAQSPIREIDLDLPALGTAPGLRQDLRIAAAREHYLATWIDYRTGRPSLWASRLTDLGQPLDSTGVPIAEVGNLATVEHEVASDGDDYLLAWANPAVHLRKIRADGGQQFPPDPGVDASELALIYLDNSHYALLFTNVNRTGVWVIILDRHGSVIRTERPLLRSDRGISSLTATLSQGREHLFVVWADAQDSRVHAQFFEVASLMRGDAIPPSMVEPAQGFALPQNIVIAAGPSGYLVTWIAPVDNRYEVRVRHLDVNGVPDREPLSIADWIPGRARPNVVWNGSHFVVTMPDASGLLAYVRFDAAGTRFDGALIPITQQRVTDSAMATRAGDTNIFVGHQVLGTTTVLNSFVFHQAMTFKAGATVSRGAPDKSGLTVVWRGNHYLAAWREVADQYALRMSRVLPTGELLGSPVTVSASADMSEPALVAGGNGTALVAFTENLGRELRILHVGADFFVRPVTGAALPAALRDAPAVVWNGTNYTVFWVTAAGTQAIRVDAQGNLLDAQPVLVSTSRFGGDLTATWTGSSYLLAGIDSIACFPVCDPVRLRHMSVTPGLVGGLQQTLETQSPANPRAGSRSSGTLLVWTEDVGGGRINLRGVRFDASGNRIDLTRGFLIGQVTTREIASVHADDDGWDVVVGRYAFEIGADGNVLQRTVLSSVIPEGVATSLALGGPVPFIAYIKPPARSNEAERVVGRFLIPQRQRAVRR